MVTYELSDTVLFLPCLAGLNGSSYLVTSNALYLKASEMLLENSSC